MKFRTLSAAITLGALLLLAACALMPYRREPPTVLRLIGDSTMADKPAADTPERGWGQLLPRFFHPEVQVVNYARNDPSRRRGKFL